MENKWTKEFPNKVGWYWFYGYVFQGEDNKELCAVRVRKISNGFAYICNGNFMSKKETGEGVFTPMTIPNLPKTEKKS